MTVSNNTTLASNLQTGFADYSTESDYTVEDAEKNKTTAEKLKSHTNNLEILTKNDETKSVLHDELGPNPMHNHNDAPPPIGGGSDTNATIDYSRLDWR